MVRKESVNDLPSGVRDAVVGDLAPVVRVHQASFRGFFLDRMGPRFLRAYYSSVLQFDGAIFLVHQNEAGQVDGFAVGFRDPGAFYQYFRSRRLRLVPIIALSLLRRPSLLLEIVRNTGRIAGSEKSGETATVELSSIGTNRPGGGIGSLLLRAFCSRSRGIGGTKIVLTTDRDNNDAVLNFYLAHGFEKRGTETRGERVLQCMSRDLASAG